MIIAGACGNPLLKCKIQQIDHEKTAGWFLIHHLNLLRKEYMEDDGFLTYIALDHIKLCHYVFNKVNPQKITLQDMGNLISTDQFLQPEDPALAITFKTQLFETSKEEDTMVDHTFSYLDEGETTPNTTENIENEDEDQDDRTMVSTLTAPLIDPNKTRSLLMIGTIYIESEIELAQAQAATLAAMNSVTEVEKLKKESAAVALQKAKEDAAGGETIGEALDTHLDKKFVSRKSLMKLLASMSSDNQPKKKSLKVKSNKGPKGQGQQIAQQQQSPKNTNRQLAWSPPGNARRPPGHVTPNSQRKRGCDSRDAGCSQGNQNRSRGNPYHGNHSQGPPRRHNGKGGRGRY